MELPNLGQHCSHKDCNQLDFLPIKCDLCTKSFCNEHYSYIRHNCPKEYTKNVQVPVCPLCNSPVPGKPDELPDYRVSRHIDADCKSDRAINQRKVYTNKCSHKGCKQKELIPVICDQCSLNFCLRHRHPQDHVCEKNNSKSASNRSQSKAGIAAALRRQNSDSHGQKLLSSMANGWNSMSSAVRGGSRSNSQPQNHYPQASIQGNMSEDRALQLALQASLAEQSSSKNSTTTTTTSPDSAFSTAQEQEDFLLAKAIAESEREAQSSNNSSQRRGNNCHEAQKVIYNQDHF